MEAAGKVAVVVGGGSSVGRASAELLTEQGARVAVLDLPGRRGEEVARSLDEHARFYECDITDEAGTEAALNAVHESYGAVHIAVNTAGRGADKHVIGRDGPLPLAEFRRVIELDLISTFNLNRLQAWLMSANEPDGDGERGVIINTSSTAAFEGRIGQVSYSAAKAGIAGMSLTMARELGPLGIRVTAIAPGVLATVSTDGAPIELVDTLPEDAGYPRRHAWLAYAIVRNSMINGQTIRLDGGQPFASR